MGPLVTRQHLDRVRPMSTSVSRRALSSLSTAAGSNCRVTRTAFSSAAACSTRSSPRCASISERAVRPNLILMPVRTPDQHARRVGLMKSINIGFDKL